MFTNVKYRMYVNKRIFSKNAHFSYSKLASSELQNSSMCEDTKASHMLLFSCTLNEKETKQRMHLFRVSWHAACHA